MHHTEYHVPAPLIAASYLTAIALFAAFVYVIFVAAAARDEALLYVGDCVDIVAQVEGAASLPPAEKWDLFADYCAQRYEDR